MMEFIVLLLIILISALPTIVIIVVIYKFLRGSSGSFNNNVFSSPLDDIWMIENIYNATMENYLRQIARQIQTANIQEAQRLRQNMEHQIQQLPREEKKVYKQKLNDVVRGKKTLNNNLEWEDG